MGGVLSGESHPRESHRAARHSRPRFGSGLVVRRRLTDLVAAAVRRPVTVVCAGPGWGKTALVASWASAAPDRVAWLTLGGEDNDRTLFWTHVLAALDAVGVGPSAEREPTGAVTDAVVARIIDGLDAMTGPVVLVLDDFHLIDDGVVLDDVDALLRYPSDRLRIVLLSRAEPSLRLHLLRAAGDVGDIRAPDLAFRPEEAALLFAAHDIRLTDEDLRAVLVRTEGWPAGLRLAAAYLANGRAVADFADDPGVTDYLAREVLAGLPADVRRFLTHTSMLDEVRADLAAAVTGEQYSQRILERLVHTHAFVQGVGASPRWFRYHPLLRDILRRELDMEAPGLVPELHRKAARWYADRNMVIEALRHAAAGRDWTYLGELAVTWFPLMVSADVAAFVGVLDQIPARELAASPHLIVAAAVLLCTAGDFGDVPQRLAEARVLMSSSPNGSTRGLEITLLTIEAMVGSRLRGDMPALVAATTDVLDRLAKARFADLPALLQFRAVALAYKGTGLLWSGQLDRAHRYLSAASSAARAAGLVPIEINALGHLALLAVMNGSLREAHEHAVHARDLAERRGVPSAPQAVAAHYALALVELEHSNLPEADRAFRQGVDAHRGGPETAQVVVTSLVRARLLMVGGDLESARAGLRRTRLTANPAMVAPALDRWHRLTESEVDLATGHADAVAARYARHTGTLMPAETVCLARAELALGGLDLAEALAARARAASPGGLVAVWSWTVTALVADAEGLGSRSVDAVATAVRIAQRDGIRRPFVGLGDRRLAALLERHIWLVRDHADFVADLLADAVTTRPVPVAAPHTDLSDREVEVVRYLPTVLTAAEIAAELRVSVNTVKAHLRSIYRKLDVTRRREAVVRACEQGLI